MAVATRYARLGKSGLEVSRICLGSNNFGGQLSADDAAKVIRRAVDLGVNFIDTANVYTDGRSEEVIGRTVKGDRDSMVIATKVGFPMPGEPDSPDLSSANILAKAEQSLRNLQTDFIDLYYLHVFDSSRPLAEPLRTMNRLVEEGKIGHYGVSNYSLGQLKDAIRLCEEEDLARPVVLQPRYNLVAREAEKDLLPYCLESRLGVAVYSPLEGGLLTGKYNLSSVPPAGSRAAFKPKYWERIKAMDRFGAADRLRSLASRIGSKPSSLAVAWVLRNRAVTSAIVGASSPSQVEENCAAAEMDFPARVFDELDALDG